MKVKKKIEINLHNHLNQSLDTNFDFSIWKITSNWIKLVWQKIENLFYLVGMALIYLVLSPVLLIKKLKNFKLKEAKPKKDLGFFAELKPRMLFFLILLIALIPFAGLRIAGQMSQLKGQVLGVSDDLTQNLETAAQAFQDQDFQLAEQSFAQAVQNLNLAEEEINQSSLALQTILKALPGNVNPEEILNIANLLSQVGVDASILLDQLDELNITPQGVGQEAQFIELSQLIKSRLQSITNNLALADQKLQMFNSALIPVEYLNNFEAIKELVNQLNQNLKYIPQTSEVLLNLLSGQKRFLVLLQNNNELRANGGFVGTIGQGVLQNGQLINLDIRSVYDLDGQMKEWIKPPSFLTQVNERVYLRDSNWLADFPTSAKVIGSLYEKEGGETPDLIIAFTPEVFIDLLGLTGPITLPTYGTTITAANFVEQIQTSTSVAYDKQLNQPKQLLADLYPSLIQKLKLENKEQILSLVQIFYKHLQQKNILLYSRDINLQNQIEQLNWAGKIFESKVDYLNIVSANLGGTKTDRELEQQANLTTQINSEGQISNKLTYTVSNPLPANPAFTNKSFVRFLIPKGSQVTSVYGFEPITEPQFSKEYTQVTGLEEWSQSISHQAVSNSYLGQEAEKMFVGGWIEVNGGQTKTITVEYQLEAKLKPTQSYNLIMQKQPGMQPLKFVHEISLDQKFKGLWASSNLKKIDNSHWEQNEIITSDQLSGLVLDR
ncbi:MAG: DUF4012 domain-containing protein [Candidatus Doudnabacteria bacterium]